MGDSDGQVNKNKQKVNNDQSLGSSKIFNMCAQSLFYENEVQFTDSNQRVDNKSAESSRLYRQRHREKINQRRREIRQLKKKSQQIKTLSEKEKNEIEQNSLATSINRLRKHTQRQQRYYERHKEEINQRKRDRRLQQIGLKSIPATAAERNRNYRERNRQKINERRRNSRRCQQNLQRVHTECDINTIDSTEQITNVTPNDQQNLISSNNNIQEIANNSISTLQHFEQTYNDRVQTPTAVFQAKEETSNEEMPCHHMFEVPDLPDQPEAILPDVSKTPNGDQATSAGLKNINRLQSRGSSLISSGHFDHHLRDNSGLCANNILTNFWNAVSQKGSLSPTNSKRTPQPQSQENEPLQESSNNYIEEFIGVKQETRCDTEHSNDSVTVNDQYNDNEYVKSPKYKENQSEEESKRTCLDTEVQSDYEEQLYEFGKFVAEQLLYLDFEEARDAQMEIEDLLKKYNKKNFVMDPSVSVVQPDILTESNPVLISVKSGPKVNTIGSSATRGMTTCSSLTPSMTHSMTSQLKTARSILSQSSLQTKSTKLPKTSSKLTINALRQLRPQSGPIHIPALSKLEALTKNVGAIGAKVVLIPRMTNPGRLATQSGNTEILPATQPRSETSVGSAVAQAGAIRVKIEDITEIPIMNLETPSVNISEVLVKTEPVLDTPCSSTNIAQSSEVYDKTRTLDIKYEPDSEIDIKYEPYNEVDIEY